MKTNLTLSSSNHPAEKYYELGDFGSTLFHHVYSKRFYQRTLEDKYYHFEQTKLREDQFISLFDQYTQIFGSNTLFGPCTPFVNF